METIAQEAKRLLEAIPEEKWLVGLYGTYNRNKCRCFIGHWNELHSGKVDYSSEEELLQNAIQEFIEPDENGFRRDGFDINDGKCALYPQPTPKQRVMALLDDMIVAGY